ncbi:MAG: class I SAM-dependent methyltransferase [Dehalococcoidia bacterium]
MAACVEAAVEGSFTDLSMFPGGRFDAVLCLGGALSHVIDPEQRVRALTELRRVAKPNAPLLISVGNVIGGFRGAVLWPYTWPMVLDAWQRGATGDLENGAPYHEFMPEEFTALLREAGLELIRFYGCQGIAAHLPPENLEALMADPDLWPVWRERLIATCDHPNVVGVSCHLIAVAHGAASAA